MNRVIKFTPGFGSAFSDPFVLEPASFLRGISSPETDVQDIVEQARQDVDAVLQTARSESRMVLEQGYAEGYKAGIREASATVSDLVARLEHDIADVAREREELVDSVEPEMLKLCVEAVEKIIRHEVKTDPRVITRTIRMCLRRLKDRDEVTVRVSPGEVDYVRSQRDELMNVAEGVRGINIIDDRRISPGGCIIESLSGDFDARLETQIEQIRRKLMETLDNDRGRATFESDEISAGNQQDGHNTN